MTDLSQTRTIRGGPDRAFTLVSFHAHPDDESLLTGGTIAQAAAAGHRVVLVVATRGERGLAGQGDGMGEDLAQVRLTELSRAAEILGCQRVVVLGYGDSGLHPASEDRAAFANTDVDAAATRLAAILREVDADVLTVYDAHGGYGHPDHVQVNRVGVRAAELAGTPVVLEATVPGTLFRGALVVLRLLGSVAGRAAPLGTHRVFSDARQITHRVRVIDQVEVKRAALRAHASQRRGGDGPRVLEWALGLPRPVFALAFGHEWFIEHGRRPGSREGDIFESLRRS